MMPERGRPVRGHRPLLVDGPPVGRGDRQRPAVPVPVDHHGHRRAGVVCGWPSVRASTFPPTAFPSTETTTSPGRIPPTCGRAGSPPDRAARPGSATWLALGMPDEGQQGPQQHEGHQEVHGRAGHRHQQPGVERLVPVERGPRRPGSTSSRLVIPGIFT